ncbi:MAG: hypothetical protein M1819_004592 [Sarea resinae]|nr:MAG: hypothetical protein M1819_006805 [Sarea resinae]KAI9832048.1 MAG: hypothetical protein M1819_004592 [Sarea resinae]
MSNYPPTPSFGMPFGGYAHQPAPYPPRHVGHAFSQAQAPPPPLAVPGLNTRNASAFQHNASGAGVPSQAFPPGMPPPPPNFFGQFPPGSFPPPPFPPVPIPQQGFPPPPPPNTHSNTYYTNSIPPPPLPPSLHQNPPTPISQQPRRSTEPPFSTAQANQGAPTSSTEVALSRADREEGELSDGEVGGIQSMSKNAIAKGAPRLSNGQHHQNEESIKGLTQSLSTPKQTAPPDKSSQQLPQLEVSSSKTDKTLERIHVNILNPSVQALMEKRTLAKNALLNLLPYKIRFAELVTEDIDSDILQGLYAEIGLKPASQTPVRTVNDDSPKKDLPESVVEHVEQPPRQLTPIPVVGHKQAITPQPLQGNGTLDIPEQNSTGAIQPRPEQETDPNPVGIESTSPPLSSKPIIPSKSTASAPFTKALLSQATTNKPAQPKLDRKDYIARLLAAKSGKPIPPVTKPPDAPSVAPNSQQKQTPELEPSPASCDTAKPEPNKTLVDSDLEAKRKAQTELARQRMEALKKGRPVNNELTGSPPENDASVQRKPENSPMEVAEPAEPTIPSPAKEVESTRSHLAPPMIHQLPPRPVTDADWNTPRVEAVPSPVIPGLFMTSSATPVPLVPAISSPSQASSSLAQDSINNRRKRPVASDFDIGPLPSTGTFKRPFGQDRSQSVVIDVSDEENDDLADDLDSEMEIESDEESHQHAPLTNPQEAPKTKSIRDLPPLSDVPKKRNTSRNGASGAKSGIITPGSKEQENLKRKEREIEDLQKKIAEIEKRRNAKQAASRAETPTTPQPTTTLSKPPFLPGSISVAPEQTPSNLGNAANGGQALEDAATLQEIQLKEAEKAKAEELAKARSEAAERRRKRRAEIESGLPVLDAAVASSKFKLEELKKEMEKLEAAVQEGLEGKKRLVEELESLGIDTEGMPVEALQAKKDEIIEQRMAEVDRSRAIALAASDASEPASLAILAQKSPPDSSVSPHVDEIHHPPISKSPSGPSSQDASMQEPLAIESQSKEIQDLEDETAEVVMDTSGSSMEEGEISNDQDGSSHDQSMSAPDMEIDKSSPDDDRETALPKEITSITHPDAETKVVEAPEVAMEDAHIQAPNVVPEEGTSGSESNEKANCSADLSFDSAKTGSTASKADGEESSSESVDEHSDEVDAYEPPEPTPSPSPPFSPAPANLPSTNTVEVPKSFQSAGETNVPTPSVAEVSSTPVVDNPEKQQSQEPQNKEAERGPKGQGRFTPYESPLKQFKAYRYHPNYKDDVAGSFRSLTYSHKINVDNPLCRYEAAGGVCNDSTCDYQHFRDMGLSDDMILVQMGAVQEGQTPEEREQYVSGLKQIIHEMRGRKVNDFNTVASELALYRSRFLHDKSRVLFL